MEARVILTYVQYQTKEANLSRNTTSNWSEAGVIKVHYK